MATLTLTPKLLDVLCLVTSKVKHLICESELGLSDNWMDDFRKYYFGLPDELLKEVGLKKNEFCFRDLMQFTVPAEWMNATPEQLAQYSFSYTGSGE